MCVLSCVILTGSPRRFVPLLRTHNAARSQEKEKPAKFANGSLLGNDSRIFVRHHGGYPLTRCVFLPQPPRIPSSSLSLSFRPFLFFKVLPSRDAGVLHPFTFYFALSPVFDTSPAAMTLCTLNFVCVLYFLSFTYHLDFCNNNVPPRSSCFLYTRLSRFFFVFMLSSFLLYRDFATCPFSVHHGVLYIPVGNCSSFLALPTFTARAARRYRLPE